MTPDEKLAALGLTLPPPPSPLANYVPIRRDGDTVYLAGQGPRLPDGSMRTGKVGKDVDVKQAYDDARLVGLQLLALMKEAAGGDLTRVEVLKLLGMVNATPEFGQHPEVINGCSDLLVEVLGESGRHACSAVGMGSLPRNISVEIEAIIRIKR